MIFNLIWLVVFLLIVGIVMWLLTKFEVAIPQPIQNLVFAVLVVIALVVVILVLLSLFHVSMPALR